MSKLPYVYWCNHLTEVGCTWRSVDFDARVVVKGLKQEEFNGFLQAKIEGKTVVVWSDKVAAPAAVRYGWANNPICNLYNREGLPASPFRTDAWKREDVKAADDEKVSEATLAE